MLERYRIEDWREMLVAVNRQLKANRAFESAKISGLLVVALDANEQFHGRCRCCPDCGQRRVEVNADATDNRPAAPSFGPSTVT